jgi:hypothetical protein
VNDRQALLHHRCSRWVPNFVGRARRRSLKRCSAAFDENTVNALIASRENKSARGSKTAVNHSEILANFCSA